MSRINTNVASLVGRNNLNRSNASLSQALTRLSTGLRINTGRDDPAGLIASENLRSDITAISRAISNTDRANQVIATADSALGQVSSLLNDIRGLVTESANTGALSDEQISANQLQLDSSLEALNRIAQTTTFQGRRLLDGSLDFLTTAGTNSTNITNLQIDQANLGATGQVAVNIEVTSAATQATIDVAGIDTAETPSTGDLDIDVAATGATGDVSFAATDLQAGGTATFGAGSFDVDATAAGTLDGVAGNGDFTITIVDAAVGVDAYDAGTNTATVNLDVTGAGADVDDLRAALAALTTPITFGTTTGGGTAIAAAGDTVISLSGGRDAGTETISVTSAATGAAVDVDVIIVEGGSAGVAVSGGDVTVTIDNTGGAQTTFADIAALIDGTAEFSATTASTSFYDTTADAPPANTTLDNGLDASTDSITITAVDGRESISVSLVTGTGVGATPTVSGNSDSGFVVTVDDALTTSFADIATALQGNAGITSATTTSTRSFAGGTDVAPTTASTLIGDAIGIDDAVVFELAGSNGSEVLSFGAGTSVADLVAGINLVSDATGVIAAINGSDAGTVDLTSSAFGGNAFVDINVISEGTTSTATGVFTTDLGQGERTNGTDVVASINGVQASGNGSEISINTATLDLTATLDSAFTGTASLTITGGGALFQLGPDVVSNQQARLGISSVNTAQLGGTSGALFQLGSGGLNDLSSGSLDTAASIVEQAIDQVTSLRGRLGAFQRTTLETNKQALNDTLVNLSEAESSIRDADFAAETAQLTRSQILVQSGTRVLAIANQNPQNVLALLN